MAKGGEGASQDNITNSLQSYLEKPSLVH